MTADDRNDYILRALEKIQEKMELLLLHDATHASEIRAIKEDLRQAIEELDSRVKPVEGFVDKFITANKFAKMAIAGIVALGGFLSAFAIFKEQLWTYFSK